MAALESVGTRSGPTGRDFVFRVRRPVSGPAWLILPTYNEADNIVGIVEAALPVLGAAAPGGHRILVVDDGSPDGTGRLADELAEKHPAVSVLHRPGRGGLGPAYLAGFARALEE